jgi:hypothetical protein
MYGICCGLLNGWVRKGRNFPLSRDKLEEVICARRNEMTLQLSDGEWALLRQVRQRKRWAAIRTIKP